MIGGWDENGCILALAPNQWSRGNGLTDQNTGNVPSYPGGAFQNCALTNMAVGFGYLYNNGDGYLNFDGVNDHLQTAWRPTWTNTNTFSCEVWYRASTGAAAQQIIFAQFQDNNNRIQFLHNNVDEKLIIIWEVGGDDDRSKTTNAMVNNTLYHLVVTKRATGVVDIYIDGVEAAYDASLNYACGNFAPAVDVRIGRNNNNTLPLAGDIYFIAFYNVEFTLARALNNFNLGRSLGIYGYNVGDTMYLRPPQAITQSKVAIPVGISI